jgi:hypothetical protein
MLVKKPDLSFKFVNSQPIVVAVEASDVLTSCTFQQQTRQCATPRPEVGRREKQREPIGIARLETL